MRVRILPSASESAVQNHYLTSFLVNDIVAVDAGSLGIYREPRDQARVGHVFLTHTHADHIGSLPVFVENRNGFFDVVRPAGAPPTVIHGSAEVIRSLKSDVFNDRVWPDPDRISEPDRPYVKFAVLQPEVTVEAAGLRITPVPVNHVVPTTGFIVDDGASAVVFGGDSGPTDRIWELASSLPHLRGVFLEATFPDRLIELAGITGHLTPRLFREEVSKCPGHVTVVAVHVRPRHRREVEQELLELGISRLILGEPGREYRL
jgi:cAMP phosphodiesterase